MTDLVIRNGTVVDGTGASSFRGDIAVAGGVITAVSPAGRLDERGAREIDADGHLVLPGWVDIHSHYDGQATWDPLLTPSSWHGVTTTVFGNCGVGFAPVQRGTEGFLINLMEGVEDIPGTVLAEGIDFTWQDFPGYLDALAATPRIMDVAAQVPHGALRCFVMGERGGDHAERPSEDEIARMGQLVAEALDAGALGFSTSRTTKHRARDGRPTPSLSAAEPELFGVAEAMRRLGKGVLQVNSDFGPGEVELLTEWAAIAGRPMSVLLLQVDNAPELWRDTLAGIHAAQARGVAMVGQVGVRPIGVMMGFDVSVNPFAAAPAWRDLARLPRAELVARLRGDADVRRHLTSADLGFWHDRATNRSYDLGDPMDYEPAPSASIAARAAAAGVPATELLLDRMLEDDGHALLLHTFENYTDGNLDNVREMLADPHTICGLGDAGAHVATICDASYPTFMLTHWARDRTRGERLPLEFLVSKQTSKTAAAYGLADRGVLAPGYRADINIVDFDALALGQPAVAHDLPAGGRRLVQHASGYRHTFVAGVEVACDGEATGALPGRLVRGAQGEPEQRRS
ncbi:MAG: amidohydrolase family protein [Acidimicrobiia bacterium]|nr:amidohydrolase family protein [Acidimicrobiia bacterium]